MPSHDRKAQSIIIEIPGTVDRRITPNGRYGPIGKNKLVREHKAKAKNATEAVLRPFPGTEKITLDPPLRLDYVIAWEKNRQRMDDSNAKASMKAIEDGIALALGIDDRHFVQGDMVQTRSGDHSGYIMVTVTELGGDDG